MPGWNDLPDTGSKSGGWDSLPDTAPPKKEKTLWDAVKGVPHSIAETYREGVSSETPWMDAGIGLAQGVSKGAQALGGLGLAAGTAILHAPSWNGHRIIDDQTQDEILGIINESMDGGSLYAGSEGQQADFKAGANRGFQQAGELVGQTIEAVGTGGLISRAKAGVGLGTRILTRGAQGLAMNAPKRAAGIVERTANGQSTGDAVGEYVKGSLVDAGTGALFSENVNKFFSGSTVPRIIAAKTAEAGLVGTGMAAGEAWANNHDPRDFSEKFVEALPGSIAQTAGMSLVSGIHQVKAQNEAKAQAIKDAAHVDAQALADAREAAKAVPTPEPITKAKATFDESMGSGPSQQELSQNPAMADTFRPNVPDQQPIPVAFDKTQGFPGPLTHDGTLENPVVRHEQTFLQTRAESLKPMVEGTMAKIRELEGKGKLNNRDKIRLAAYKKSMESLTDPNYGLDAQRDFGVKPDNSGIGTVSTGDGEPVQRVPLSGREGERGAITIPGKKAEEPEVFYGKSSSGKEFAYTIENGKPKLLDGEFKIPEGKEALTPQERQVARVLPQAEAAAMRKANAALTPEQRTEVMKRPSGADVSDLSPEQQLFHKYYDLAGGLKPEEVPGTGFWRDRKNELALDVGEQGEDMKLIGRARLGRTRKAGALLDAEFGKAIKPFENLSPRDAARIANAVEGVGNAQLRPEEVPLVNRLKELHGNALKELMDLGILKKGAEGEYWGRDWQSETGANQADMSTHRPIEGAKDFAKQRTFSTYEEGVQAGKIPGTTNTFEFQVDRLKQAHRAIEARKWLNEAESMGLAAKVAEGTPAESFERKGWKKLNGAGDGTYYAPEGAATVWNNHQSKGLKDGSLYDAAAMINSGMNKAQLVGPFHAMFVSADAIASRAALGVQKTFQGDVAGGIKDAMTAIAAPVMNAKKGYNLRKNFNAGKSDHVLDALFEGGFTIGSGEHGPQQVQKAVGAFKEAWQGTNLKGMAKSATPAAMEKVSAVIDKISSPIMEHAVPVMKLAVAHELATFELSKLGKNPTEMQVRKAMAKVVDSVDNRLGQMTYDNLFWNRTAKDIAQVTTRSVGWNLGTIREIGGSVVDTAGMLKRMATKGQKAGDLTSRQAYVVGLTATTMMLGSIAQYLMTGEAPDTKTLMGFAKTGDQDQSGNDIRSSTPGYQGDVYKYYRDWMTTLGHKVGPLLGTIGQIKNNQDFYGNKIYDETASMGEKAKHMAGYAVGQFTPFSVKNAMNNINQTGGDATSPSDWLNKRVARNALGFGDAPSWLNKTKSEELIGKYAGENNPVGGRGYNAAKHAEDFKAASAMLHQGQTDDDPTEIDKATSAIEGMMQEGRLTPADLKKFGMMGPEAKGLVLIAKSQRLTLPQLKRVLDAAEESEKQYLQAAFARKAANAPPTPENQKIIADFMKTMEAQ